MISLAHGSGGKLSRRLIEEIILPRFNNSRLARLEDGAYLETSGKKLVFTTDCYVVKPIFFPGGDIGKLSVCGTVNDLAVMGARPLYLSLGLILEEGLSMDILEKVLDSLKETAVKNSVEIVTGDTKVVSRGQADGIYMNTAGIGILEDNFRPAPEKIQPGDKVVINGSIGDHGMAVLSVREKFGFEAKIESDCAGLWGLIQPVIKRFGDDIRFMRDPTRGGVVTVLNEVVTRHDSGILLDESSIPVKETVKVLCELLGMDPLYVANEGKVLLIVKNDAAEKVLDEMRKNPLGKESRIIGEVVEKPSGKVGLKTRIGGTRLLDMPAGEQLPRIC